MSSERLGEARYYRDKGRSNTVLSVLLGTVVAIGVHEGRQYLSSRDKVTIPTDAEVSAGSDTTTTLSSEQREALYGKQQLFVCVIPGPDGTMRQIELNIGGPETPIEAARILEPDFEKAWVLLEAGIEEYNGLAQGPQAQLSRANELGVVFSETQVPSTTQVWGIKAMTVDVFMEQNGL